jgi:hypothetical protein
MALTEQTRIPGRALQTSGTIVVRKGARWTQNTPQTICRVHTRPKSFTTQAPSCTCHRVVGHVATTRLRTSLAAGTCCSMSTICQHIGVD